MNGFSSLYTSTANSSFLQSRLYTISRSGSGEAFYVLLSPRRDQIINYQIRGENWKATKDVADFGVAVLRNMLYIIGGFNVRTAKHIKRVMRFDPDDGIWKEMKSLPAPRAKFATTVHEGKILVLGGEEADSRVTSSCLMYDPTTNEWTEVSSLVSPRANHACAVCNNEIYCAGGRYGNKCHKNLWVNEGGQWEDLGRPYPQQLPVPLDRLAMVAIRRKIYFTGGVLCVTDKKDGKRRFLTERRMFSYTTSVSALSRDDSEEGEVISQELLSPWGHALPNMICERHSHGAIAIGDKIYVMGGTQMESGQPVRETEFYDTITGTWEEDFRFRKGDVSNVTCAILEVPYKQDEHKLNARLRWVMW